MIHFNITLPSTPSFSNWFLSLKFPSPICTSPLPRTCYIPGIFHFSWVLHPNNVWWVVLLMKIFAFFFTSLLPHISQPEISSWATYSLTPTAYVSPSVAKFQTHTKTTDKSVVFVFIKIFFDSKLEDKYSATNVSRLLQLFYCIIIIIIIVIFLQFTTSFSKPYY